MIDRRDGAAIGQAAIASHELQLEHLGIQTVFEGARCVCAGEGAHAAHLIGHLRVGTVEPVGGFAHAAIRFQHLVLHHHDVFLREVEVDEIHAEDMLLRASLPSYFQPICDLRNSFSLSVLSHIGDNRFPTVIHIAIVS